jgi:hypothetical protein
MSLQEMIIKANQRHLLVNRRSIQYLKESGAHITAGARDETAYYVAKWREANASLLWANAYIRRTLHAART